MPTIYSNITGAADAQIVSRAGIRPALVLAAARIVRAGGGTLALDARIGRYVVGDGPAAPIGYREDVERATGKTLAVLLADAVLTRGAAGLWTEDGEIFYLDFVRTFSNIEDARSAAELGGEIAFYDTKAGISIYVTPPLLYTLETNRFGHVTLSRSTDTETVYFQSEGDIEALVDTVPELFEDAWSVTVSSSDPRAELLADYFGDI